MTDMPLNEQRAVTDPAVVAKAREGANTLSELARLAYEQDKAGKSMTDDSEAPSKVLAQEDKLYAHTMYADEPLSILQDLADTFSDYNDYSSTLPVEYPSQRLPNGHTLSFDDFTELPTIQLGQASTINGMSFPAGTVFHQDAGFFEHNGEPHDWRTINLPNGVQIRGNGLKEEATSYTMNPYTWHDMAEPLLSIESNGQLQYAAGRIRNDSRTIRFPEFARRFSPDPDLRLLLNARHAYPRTVPLASVVADEQPTTTIASAGEEVGHGCRASAAVEGFLNLFRR